MSYLSQYVNEEVSRAILRCSVVQRILGKSDSESDYRYHLLQSSSQCGLDHQAHS